MALSVMPKKCGSAENIIVENVLNKIGAMNMPRKKMCNATS